VLAGSMFIAMLELSGCRAGRAPSSRLMKWSVTMLETSSCTTSTYGIVLIEPSVYPDAHVSAGEDDWGSNALCR
jgi:hypothetical protein